MEAEDRLDCLAGDGNDHSGHPQSRLLLEDPFLPQWEQIETFYSNHTKVMQSLELYPAPSHFCTRNPSMRHLCGEAVILRTPNALNDYLDDAQAKIRK